jgi:hypothetical protein
MQGNDGPPQDHLAVHGDRAALARELDGVGEEVGEHLAKPVVVPKHRGGHPLAALHPQREPLAAEGGGEEPRRRHQPRAWAEGDGLNLQPSVLYLGEIEDVIEQGGHCLDALDGGFGRLLIYRELHARH